MKRRIVAFLLASLASVGALAAEPALVPISQEALLERQQKGDESTYVLDVRSPEEYASGHVPGAVNIPYDQVASRIAEVPKDKDVVLYCKSGRRAGIAAEVLAGQGAGSFSVSIGRPWFTQATMSPSRCCSRSYP
jgi:phage shock protein E